MKPPLRNGLLLTALMCCVGWVCAGAARAATGDVWRSNVWNGNVDGVAVYRGSSMFDCVNACINAMSSGTVHIWNSGDSGPGTSSIYAINIKDNITLDFHGNTVNCNGNDLIVPVLGIRADNITIKNLHVTGAPRYGIWLQTCNDINIDNITMNVTGGLGIRVDDAKNEGSSSLTIGSVNITGTGTHAVETYSVNNINITEVVATDVGGCGLLLNNSTNAWVGAVYGTRCDSDGGYAAFRVANTNGSTVCEYVYARECGRGFFSVSGSQDCTVLEIDAANCRSHGIAIQDSTNTHVLSGEVANCNPDYAIWGSGSGNTITLARHVEGVKSFVNRASGRAMDVYNWNNTNGGNIAIYDFWGGAAQQWNVERVGGGLYSIRTVLSGNRSLDVWNFGTTNGTNIALYDFVGSDNQLFYLENLGNGYFRVTPSHATAQCVDAYGTSNGSNVGTWSYGGGNNQQWSIVDP